LEVKCAPDPNHTLPHALLPAISNTELHIFRLKKTQNSQSKPRMYFSLHRGPKGQVTHDKYWSCYLMHDVEGWRKNRRSEEGNLAALWEMETEIPPNPPLLLRV